MCRRTRPLLAAALAAGVLASPAYAEPVGPATGISDDADGFAPRAAYDSSGRPLVVWQGHVRGEPLARGRFLSGPFLGTFVFANPRAYTPDVAYNASRNEFVLVWATRDRVQVAVIRHDGTTSPQEVGAGDGSSRPAISHNPANGEYLVAWATGSRVVTRRLSPLGDPAGNSRRVGDGGEPDVVAGPSGGYLVVWHKRSSDAWDVFGQRITATNRETGANDFRISAHHNLLGETANHVPAVAWNPSRREALVVFSDRFEVFAQRLSSSGSRVGSNRPLSSMGPEGDARFTADRPDVAFGRGGYLVVWNGRDGDPDLIHIYGQHLSSSGSSIGANDFQISEQGSSDYLGEAAVGTDPTSRGFLAAWSLMDSQVYVRRVVAP
jgi:hypothetical protein